MIFDTVGDVQDFFATLDRRLPVLVGKEQIAKITVQECPVYDGPQIRAYVKKVVITTNPTIPPKKP